MDAAQTTPATPNHGHKRSRSAVLKSIVTPARTPSPSKKSPVKSRADNAPQHQAGTNVHTPHAVLGEINHNACFQSGSPTKSKQLPHRAMPDLSRENTRPALLSRLSPARKQPPKSSSPVKDQENTTPPATALPEAPAPIWSQFTSQPSGDPFGMSEPEHRVQENRNSRVPHVSGVAQALAALEGAGEDGSRGRTRAADLTQPPSKVKAAVARLNGAEQRASQTPLQKKQLDDAFEAVLTSRNIPENMRQNMRQLDPAIKSEFIRNAEPETPKAETAEPAKSSFWGTLSRGRARSNAADRDAQRNPEQSASPSKRSRSRSRTFTLSKSDGSPSKRARSNSRPRSLMLLKNLSSSSVHTIGGNDGAAESKDQPSGADSPGEPKDALRRPDDFVKYLREQQKLSEIEVGRLHKLRLLLRNETVSWVDTFILKEGMKELLGLLNRLREIEWREEHDDLLLHEVLLCLKGLCTTERALDKLAQEASVLFPDLLNMLFDEERRGPSEFTTRGIVINLLYTHLATTPAKDLERRAESILLYLSDPCPPEEAKPVGFILDMQQRRPYQRWCKEISNVTKEVFWIFLHKHNVISTSPAEEAGAEGRDYRQKHFPKARPPVPAASWVGGVEWEACNYLTAHLDLMNGLVASMSSQAARNKLRRELEASGFEKIMSNTLRTCKEKFYGSIHDGLRTWIDAATEDGWDAADVKMGPPKDDGTKSPSKSPSKSPKKADKKQPQLELPKLELGEKNDNIDVWL